MKNLEIAFKRKFGIPLPQYLLPRENLVPIGDPEESLLFGSPSAVQKPYLIQGDIKSFIDTAPEGYFLIGFWGHGVNSYAFYYSRVDNWSRILFRLPYGGVYMDNDKMAQKIRAFLTCYIEFEKSNSGRLSLFIAIDSMSEGYYKAVTKDGKSMELKESLFCNPEFEKKILRGIDA
jgi:hypothetical protein